MVNYCLNYSWYPLLCKPGQNKTGYRGELEVKLGFTVRANQGGGSSGNRGSISSINKVMKGNLCKKNDANDWNV